MKGIYDALMPPDIRAVLAGIARKMDSLDATDTDMNAAAGVKKRWKTDAGQSNSDVRSSDAVRRGNCAVRIARRAALAAMPAKNLPQLCGLFLPNA